MLNLKKINLQQKLNTNPIDQEDTTFIEETLTIDQLTQIIKQKPTNTLHSISQLLSQQQFHTSISASQFTQILLQATSQSNLTQQSNIQLALNILQTLISIPQYFFYNFSDQKQVKSHIKKQKLINPTFILALIWSRRQNNKVWKYVDYMIECFPTEMILNGKEHIKKWQQFFVQYQQKIQESEKINQIIKQQELKQKIRKQVENNKDKGFVDSYIYL